MAKAHTVMPGLLVNACSEEPDALIALVRVCGGAPRVTGGSTRKIETTEEHGAASGRNQKTWNYEIRERPRKGFRQGEMFLRGQSAFKVQSIKGLRQA